MNKAYSLAKKTSLHNRAQKIIGERQKRLENFKTERKGSPSEKIKKRKNEKNKRRPSKVGLPTYLEDIPVPSGVFEVNGNLVSGKNP